MKMEGFAEAIELLKHLPESVQRTVMLKTMRICTKPVITAAKGNISGYSKSLARSIGNITGRSKKYPTIYVGPRAKGAYKDDGWYGHFVEFGVSGIIGKKKKGGFKRKSDNEDFAKYVGSRKGGERYRKDQPPRPFMRPAIDQNKDQVASNLKTEVSELIKKHIERYNKRKR